MESGATAPTDGDAAGSGGDLAGSAAGEDARPQLQSDAGSDARAAAMNASGAPSSAGAGGATTGIDAAAGHASPPGPSTLDPALIGVPKQIGMGYTLAEGPIWDHCGNRLLFADVEASTLYSLGMDGAVTMFATDTNFTNGMAFDLDGSLLMAQMGGSSGHGALVRRDRAGMTSVIVDKDLEGTPLHTVDDVAVAADGTIYFSDGDFAHGMTYSTNGWRAPFSVYALKPGAMPALIKGDTARGPNGIEFSPDEMTMYVDGYGEGTVWKFKIDADGAPRRDTALITGLSYPDSLCLDVAGNLYVGVSKGLQILKPDGTKLSLIPIDSSKGVTNCAFGGPDGKTLYITAWTGLWEVANMPIAGLEWTLNQTRISCQ